jgi:Asp-tRNA(Asn)/Glu-tRNA(Gln) amidotransferase A subunit family amidase
MLGLSSVHGQTKNVYIPTNGPGGSSGGTATAVSANLAMVGLGSDTGGSIRIPSALAGLVGIRPTQSLSDLRGVAPLSPTQDTVGPMCRKVEDCAKVLQFTEKNSSAARKKQIVNALNGKGLKGAKIAMVSAMFPPRTTENKVYWQVIDEALEAMQEAGAIVHDVVLPEQDKILNDFISLSRYEIKPSLNEYLQSWPSDKDAHIRDYDEMLAVPNGLAASTVPWVTLYGEKSDNRDSDPVYLENSQGRYEFVRKQVLSALGSHDALLYPTLTELNGPIGKNTEGRKNVSLSPFSGMPAISFPAGMTKDANPQPIAFELLGKDGSEPVLINLVAGFEKAHNARVEPKLAK